MAKRKNGEGSWGEKTIKGEKYKYFRKQYEGMENPKYFYGKTEKEVKAKIKAFEEGNKKFTPAEIRKLTFGEYMSNWLYNVKQLEVKRRTFDGYEDTFKNQILEYKEYDLSGKQIGAIDQDIFQKYYNSLAKRYSRAAIKKNYTLINQCLDYAKTKGDISENFITNVTLPSEDNVAIKKKEILFLPEEDMEKLYHESKRVNEPGFNFGGKLGQPVYGSNAQAIVLIEYTGLRVGELLGLRWSDYDKDTKYLNIRNNLSTIKNRDKKDDSDNKYVRVDTSVKTQKGNRSIPLHARAIEMLEYFEKLNSNHKPDDYIMINKEGNVINQRNLTRTLNAMLSRAKCSVEKCGLHSLRHSFGSFLILHGADIKVVSELLGHKDVSTTYNIYVHILPKQHESVIDLFNEMGKDKEDKDK